MKILIGYDGSARAENAMKELAKAGLPGKAEVILLVAIPPLLPLDSLAPEGYAVSWYADAYAEAVKNARRTESKAKAKGNVALRRLKKYFPGWKITLESTVDVPSHAILNRADKWKPDMVLVGSHGWNPLGKLLLGSVAEKVLTHAHGNVRLGKTARPERSGPPRILIAFDGSKEAHYAVEEVADRQWPKGTAIKLIAVSDFQIRLDQITMAIRNNQVMKKTLPTQWLWMETQLAKATAKLSQPGVKVDSSIAAGDPRHVILAEAKRFKADTLFLGNRGLTGMKRFMLGSVSAAVASHSPCSVEIIRGIPDRV